MAELILELSTRPGQARIYRPLDVGELRLGRGFDNDLIIPDPYIGANQLRLVRHEDAVEVVILDRTNVASLNGRPCIDTNPRMLPGDVLKVGHTSLRLLSSAAPVPPAQQLAATPWARLGIWRGVLAVLMLALTCAYALFFDVQETVERINWLQQGMSVLLLGLIIVSWASLWALLGHLLRHRAQLSSQLFVSSAMTWLMMQVTIAAGYLDYASNLSWLAEGFDWLMSALVSVILLYYNLEIATRLRRPLATASVLICTLFAAVFVIEMMQRHEYRGLPTLQPSLKPPFAKLHSGQDLDATLQRLPDIFADP